MVENCLFSLHKVNGYTGRSSCSLFPLYLNPSKNTLEGKDLPSEWAKLIISLEFAEKGVKYSHVRVIYPWRFIHFL